jgi:hypothetical protein
MSGFAIHEGNWLGSCQWCGHERCGCYAVIPNGSDPSMTEKTCTCAASAQDAEVVE